MQDIRLRGSLQTSEPEVKVINNNNNSDLKYKCLSSSKRERLLEQNWFCISSFDFDDNKVFKDQLVVLIIYSSVQD
jgi:hypothetical protein